MRQAEAVDIDHRGFAGWFPTLPNSIDEPEPSSYRPRRVSRPFIVI
jgi:hypothetical protein